MAHLTRGALPTSIVLSAIVLLGCNEDATSMFEPEIEGPEASAPSAGVMPEAVGQVYERVGREANERYDVSDDGTFRLQFVHGVRFFEYLGTYSLDEAGIYLDFHDSNTAGEWRATGTFNGHCLTVEYNLIMFLAGFEDGNYCRPAAT